MSTARIAEMVLGVCALVAAIALQAKGVVIDDGVKMILMGLGGLLLPRPSDMKR